MHFKNLDMNLLVALETLLSTGSVSETARRLNLSQPAVSGALRRLRAYFKDDLLVLYGRQMVPTAYGRTLRPMVVQILLDVGRLVATSAQFDPASSDRRFRICASDYISLVLIGPLLERLAREAPAVRIQVIAPYDNFAFAFEQGEIDLIVAPEHFTLVDPHPIRPLFVEDHVVIGCRDNPALAGAMTMDAFLSCGHVTVGIGRHNVSSFADQQMREMGIARKVEVMASSFTMVPWLLPGTSRLAVVHRRLADFIAPVAPLAVAELPFALPPMREVMQYHQANAAEAGLDWLMTAMAQVAQR